MLTRLFIPRFRNPSSRAPFTNITRRSRNYMARKFDFDYNFDPEGTSLVKIDPYTDSLSDEDSGNPGSQAEHRDPYDEPSRNVPMSAETHNRARSPSRSPPPKKLQPSAEYIATSLGSSSKLDDSKNQRKLLILDLNGTLVFRSPHQKRNTHQPQGNSRPLRSVHRRPYLLAFTDYLLDPSVTTWLDTMVWSSAQPHSVADMTEKCFAGRKNELLAVWARDTLGLSQEEYHRKTQTTKDLARPWSELAHLHHSAKTTLLLDDSPLKAHLQPWNHLCIKEYVADMRQNDVKVRDAELANGIQQDMFLEEPSRKRKDNGKTERKQAERIATATADATGTDGQALEYDQTLLAVVGILEAIKDESNVAAWMRSGGLVHVSHSARSRSGTPGPLKKPRYSGGSTRCSPSDSESTAPTSSSPVEPSPSSFGLSVAEDQQEDTGIPLLEPLAEDSPHPGLWFDHPDAFLHWVERGRRALDALGIEVYHGIIGSTS